MALDTIGMSVPGSSALGLGSDLQAQVAGETEEQRRKRLLAQQQRALIPGVQAGSSALMTGYSAAGAIGGR